MGEGVSPSKFEMVAFTDSDHTIQYNGANEWLYRYLSGELYAERNRNLSAPLMHQWGKREDVVEETVLRKREVKFVA